MRSKRSSSSPLAAETTTASARRPGASSTATARSTWDGTARITTRASASASRSAPTAWTPSGSRMPGRYQGFSRVRRMSSSSSASKTQRRTGCPARVT